MDFLKKRTLSERGTTCSLAIFHKAKFKPLSAACVRCEWVKLCHLIWSKFTYCVGYGTYFHQISGSYVSVSVVARMHDYFTMFELLLKVPLKWNFRLIFYSKILKSMILWFVIFEFGLRTSAYKFFSELQSWPIWVKMCDIPRMVKLP